ncbi:hypothetical protein JTB14_021797 [Gonioctena quinquepunctata]|nr:hypothetical protein JTB14_021797 [Gonioctena quinquepunctata]
MNKLYQDFQSRFGLANNYIRNCYPIITSEDQKQINLEYDSDIIKNAVKIAISSIKVDTAAGPDRILARAIRNKHSAEVMQPLPPSFSNGVIFQSLDRKSSQYSSTKKKDVTVKTPVAGDRFQYAEL